MFLLFAGDSYYASGGWRDFKGAFTTLEDAIIAQANEEHPSDWWHVVDLSTNEVVKWGTKLISIK